MDSETVTHSEVSQKMQNKCHILTCGIQKNGMKGLIFKAEVETQREKHEKTQRENNTEFERGVG